MKHAGNGIYALLQYKKTFADLNGHWAKAEIESMASKLLVNGVNANSYAPGKVITRAEFTAMLVRAMGLSPVIESGAFKDVQDASGYAGEIGAALRYGLIEGGTGGLLAQCQHDSSGNGCHDHPGHGGGESDKPIGSGCECHY